MIDKLSQVWEDASRSLTGRPEQGGTGSLAAIAAYSLTFLLGAAIWVYILDLGRIPFDLHDWAEGTGHRLAFLQNAVMEWRLPLHMPDGSALRNVTDRFISTPDVILSPQILALRVLSLGHFVLFNTLLLYAAGFVGMLRLARRLSWSPLVFVVVFLLFSLNGHIVDHIVVGHMHWAGYFLLPFFFESILHLLEGPNVWRWSLGFALILFAIFLQGAYHLFVMCLMFMAALTVGQRRLWRYGLIGGFSSLLVSAVRILPPALEYGKFDSEFLSGFVSVGHVWQALTDLRAPRPELVFSQTPLTTLGWWEFDHYVGWIGLAFLLGFGLVGWLRSEPAERLPPALAIPAFIMFFLSIGQTFEPINRMGIPLISSQRVATRFVIFTILTLLLASGTHFQALLSRRKIGNTQFLGVLGLVALLAQDLWQHVKLWRVQRMPELFPNRGIDLSGEFIANHPDPAYGAALVLGLSIGALTLAALAWRARRAAQDSPSTGMAPQLSPTNDGGDVSH